jgi:hypothetical protein
MRDSAVAAEAVKETVKNTAQQRGIRKKKITSLLSFIGSILFRLRKLVLAAPVVYAAVKLAYYNRVHLPEQVGINIQSTGEFAQMITRDMAVMGPLGLTAACLLLMLCSRKALYPWAISIFTLVLPLLILFSNLYPA